MKYIEIYVRVSGNRTLLNFHVPKELKRKLIDGIARGTFQDIGTRVNLEFHTLSEWSTTDQTKEGIQEGHFRIPISELHFKYDE